MPSRLPHHRKIAVIGLGYAGLPVAGAFARSGVPVVGFDVDYGRIHELRSGFDRRDEVDGGALSLPNIRFTSRVAEIASSDFFVIVVPTGVDKSYGPDLRTLLEACELVGRHIKRGDIVVCESTVYPGATEGECVPVLEQASGLVAGKDFSVGYSPERVNPGDKDHPFEAIKKVVASPDRGTLDIMEKVYGAAVFAGVHRAASIKVAEAAKLIENAQRDVNIAFMNEISRIFHTLGIDTSEVLAAAGTKWNFGPFAPGLVGGPCIGLASQFLRFASERNGSISEIISSSRRLNSSVCSRLAKECARRVFKGRSGGGIVTVLGVAFKENVKDVRNSAVVDLICRLTEFGIFVQTHDPYASREEVRSLYAVSLADETELMPANAVILAVPHEWYCRAGWPFVTGLLKDRRGLVMDIKAKLDRASVPDGVELWRM